MPKNAPDNPEYLQDPAGFSPPGDPLADLAMPPAVIPDPEPPQPLEGWRDVTPGTPAFPVKNLDGTFSAGGLVKETLCVGPDGRPRCVKLGDDGRCSGPPTEEMRRDMTKCIAFRDRYADFSNQGRR